MKYIAKFDLPFVKKGDEIELIIDGYYKRFIRVAGHDDLLWSHKWEDFESWFEPKRWKPNKGELYWIITFEQGDDGMSDVAISKHVAEDTVNGMWAPCFPSLEQAEKARTLVLEALKKAHE